MTREVFQAKTSAHSAPFPRYAHKKPRLALLFTARFPLPPSKQMVESSMPFSVYNEGTGKDWRGAWL